MFPARSVVESVFDPETGDDDYSRYSYVYSNVAEKLLYCTEQVRSVQIQLS